MKDEKGIPMPEPNGFTSAMEGENEASEQPGSKSAVAGLSRRTFLGVGSASLASAAQASLAVNAQERVDPEKADHDQSASNPGPSNFCVIPIQCSSEYWAERPGVEERTGNEKRGLVQAPFLN